MTIHIKHIDHIVMTVNDINKTCMFYQEVLSMDVKTFKNNRKALHFGSQKINLHQKGNEFEPKANHPTIGAIDLCFIVETPINKVIQSLNDLNIKIEQGPVERTGALGKIISIYLRDPDYNLIELANYL